MAGENIEVVSEATFKRGKNTYRIVLEETGLLRILVELIDTKGNKKKYVSVCEPENPLIHPEGATSVVFALLRIGFKGKMPFLVKLDFGCDESSHLWMYIKHRVCDANWKDDLIIFGLKQVTTF